MMREFFYLQKSDRKVVLALLAVIVIALGVILFTSDPGNSGVSQNSRDSSYDRNASNSPLPTRQIERFPFDPNTADSAQLRRLGLQSWQIRNIYKFRAAGGIYRKPLDFARLYGLTVKEYRELEPYIRISSDYLPAATLVKEGATVTDEHDTALVRRYPQKINETSHVVLNTADTTELMTIPGIGPYFAKKIVQYGQRLGGYVSVDQLDEIEDFPTESKRFLVVEGATPKKLNVNKLTLNELKRHPYISFYQARDITDYRRLHGPLRSLNDLRLSRDFPPEAITRLLPYVEF
jgi:DNA uptake protein ComE-like DNA-binding protein